jgi:hypothetical protein
MRRTRCLTVRATVRRLCDPQQMSGSIENVLARGPDSVGPSAFSVSRSLAGVEEDAEEGRG